MAVTADSEPFSEDFVRRLLDAMAERLPDEPVRVEISGAQSNEVARVRYDDGRTLMVKRARHYPEAAAERFDSARRATALLRERTDVVAPEHLPIPDGVSELPVVAYWRIDLPTLKESWRSVRLDHQDTVLRSWGDLVRRVHGIRLTGCNKLAYEGEGTSFVTFMQWDVGDRLIPSMRHAWPEGLAAAERLLAAIPAMAERLPERYPVLLHNDLHMANVLCERTEEGVRCVGVLDLEHAWSGPPESDLAKIDVYHGRLFGHPLPGRALDRIGEGYGHALDPMLLAFFRSYHLVNTGYHAALVGQRAHAAEVAREAAKAARALDDYSNT